MNPPKGKDHLIGTCGYMTGPSPSALISDFEFIQEPSHMQFDMVAKHEEIEVQHHSPERLLLIAVLDRATRDLELHVTRQERKEAIYWFRQGFKGIPAPYPAIGFFNVIEILELNASQIDFLQEKLYAAERCEIQLQKEIKNQLEAKREACRAGLSSFFTGERLPICEENCPVPREIRAFRRRGRRVSSLSHRMQGNSR